MRNRIPVAILLLLGATASARAQDPPTLPAPTDAVTLARAAMDGKLYGTIDFGARISDVVGDEARFQRYRDLRSGIYANNALIGRRTEDWSFEAQAWNIGYRDQRYQVDLQRVGRLTASFLWDQIPLFISRDTETLYTEPQPGVFRLEDNMQQQIQAGAKTLRDFEDQAVRFDLRTMRRVGQGDVVFNVDESSDVAVMIRGTTRNGAIPYGGTFGFSNAVELPATVDTRTSDLRTSYEWANSKGLVKVGWDGSGFENEVGTMVWDNPLRYGPDISGGPSQGRMALWPSNTLTYLHGTGALSLPARGRLTGYVAIGQGRSDEDLLPFTINTAFAPIPLVRPTAEAESQMTIAQFQLAMRPAQRLAINAKYRYSDVDVQTPIFERPNGSISYDTSFAAAAGPGEYHSVNRTSFDADGSFALLPFTSLKAGYSHLASDYTHRIWESTAEDVFRVSLDTAGNAYFNLRALFENRSREGDGFDAGALAEVGELPGMRHYDVANRNRNRFTLIANVTPRELLAFTASAGIGRDEYPDSPHGLQFYDSDQYLAGFLDRPRWLLRHLGELRLGKLQIAPAIPQRQRRGAAGRSDPRLDHRLYGRGQLLRGRRQPQWLDRAHAHPDLRRLEQVQRHVSVRLGYRLANRRPRAVAAGQERVVADGSGLELRAGAPPAVRSDLLVRGLQRRRLCARTNHHYRHCISADRAGPGIDQHQRAVTRIYLSALHGPRRVSPTDLCLVVTDAGVLKLCRLRPAPCPSTRHRRGRECGSGTSTRRAARRR